MGNEVVICCPDCGAEIRFFVHDDGRVEYP
jgi:hypothetical protein